ncbi:hypothetical protein H1Q63_18720 [Desmonostoc muscorum CCALA 125]|nr:hypothetical protein [Desmonostoc muscorum CCALA 125]
MLFQSLEEGYGCARRRHGNAQQPSWKELHQRLDSTFRDKYSTSTKRKRNWGLGIGDWVISREVAIASLYKDFDIAFPDLVGARHCRAPTPSDITLYRI